MKRFIIEVQKKSNDEELFEHYGYIDLFFKTSLMAKKYVKEYNNNIRFTGSRRRQYFYTNVNHLTGFRFIVRKYNKEKLNLRPF